MDQLRPVRGRIGRSSVSAGPKLAQPGSVWSNSAGLRLEHARTSPPAVILRHLSSSWGHFHGWLLRLLRGPCPPKQTQKTTNTPKFRGRGGPRSIPRSASPRQAGETEFRPTPRLDTPLRKFSGGERPKKVTHTISGPRRSGSSTAGCASSRSVGDRLNHTQARPSLGGRGYASNSGASCRRFHR